MVEFISAHLSAFSLFQNLPGILIISLFFPRVFYPWCFLLISVCVHPFFVSTSHYPLDPPLRFLSFPNEVPPPISASTVRVPFLTAVQAIPLNFSFPSVSFTVLSFFGKLFFPLSFFSYYIGSLILSPFSPPLPNVSKSFSKSIPQGIFVSRRFQRLG